MEFLQLRYFYETAQNENLTKTAEKFMVPSSSVSASIKRLETELGTKLFDRAANRIKLNENGYRLAETLGEIFEKLKQTVSEITESQTQPCEIGMLIRTRRKWITELIIEYRETHPDVCFRISNDFSTRDFEDFDIIIDEQSDIYGDRERFLLVVEQFCIKASKNSPLVGRSLTFRQLREQPFVMPPLNNGVRKLLDSTGKRHGFSPKITIECNDTYCLAKYVKANMGLTLGSRRALAGDAEKDMVALNVTDFHETQAVYVYHRRWNAHEKEIREFCEFLFKKGQERI